MLPLWPVTILCGCIAEAVFIVFEYRKKMLTALILKAFASMMFVLLAVLLLPDAANSGYAALIVAGLAFGAIGDVCLNLRHLVGERGKQVFMIGIAAFLIGHLFYLFALIRLAPQMLIWSVPLCAVLSFFLLRFILRRIEVQGAIRTFGILYLVVVFLMMCCALGLLPVDPGNPAYLLFILGAILFAGSDVLLVLGQFGIQKHSSFRAMNLSFYYLGQICIAITIALMR